MIVYDIVLCVLRSFQWGRGLKIVVLSLGLCHLLLKNIKYKHSYLVIIVQFLSGNACDCCIMYIDIKF